MAALAQELKDSTWNADVVALMPTPEGLLEAINAFTLNDKDDNES